MNSTKILSFFTKQYFVIYLLSLGVFCFSVWGAKAGMIPCILGFLLFLKNNKINKTQIVKDLYPIRWWIFVNLGILSMAFISLFFCFDILQTLKAIVFFLIIPLFIFLCFFLVFKRSDSKIQKTGLTLIFSVFILHTICTIMVFFLYEKSRSVGLGDNLVIPYTLFLLLPFSLSLSFFAYSRFKFFAISLFFLSLFALYTNGTRASILSVGLMLISFVFYPTYKHKKIFTVIFLFLTIIFGYIFIEWSDQLKARFNFKHMIEKLDIVWSYSPAEMGRFDTKCFDSIPAYRCSKYSGNILNNHFTFESNALNRISLYKSTFLAISESPFKPHGFAPFFFNQNLKPKDDKNLPYCLDKDNRPFYPAAHNSFLSAFFELGLIGGLFYCLFFLILIFYSFKNKNLYGCILFLWLCGLMVQNFLDAPFAYGGITSSFFALIGMFLAIITKKEKNAT